MRLTHVKLAGFKSFVDPTNIPVPGQLVAVVGPNGCGKSNVIDAVRWVLGESSAKQLRGESMQDVIFNGSGTRKPASRASVELVFDNSEGRASGAWGQYTEIAIKRVLTRQGESSYWINNQQVRRRDIADLFLGTGVGTKGYAVIEQGMISRIIEARPEELRAYLEEAAGVSKYKERRRETESRLSDTRDNLERLNDIREELNRQVEKLGEQAEVAQHYHQLREDLTLKQNLLALVKKHDAREAEAAARIELARLEAEQQALASQSTELEALLEAAREAHFAATDAMQERQSELADASAQVARLEEQQRHRKDTVARIEREFAAAKTEQSGLTQQLGGLAAELDEWQDKLEEARLVAEDALMEADGGDALPEAEATFRQCDGQLAALTDKLAELTRRRDLSEQQARHAERTLAQLAERRERLAQERAALALPDMDALALVREEAELAAQEAELARQQLHEAETDSSRLDAEHRAAAADMAGAREALARREAEAAALGKLIEQALAREGLGDWLQAQGLADAPRLLDAIQVQPGWETALEAALAHAASVRLSEAVPAGAPPARLVVLAEAGGVPMAAEAGRVPLRDKLTLLDARFAAGLDGLLAGCFAADSLEAALAARAGLAAHECWITPDGHRVSAAAIDYYAPDGEGGLVGRRAEHERLQGLIAAAAPEMRALAERLAGLDQAQDAARQAIRAARERLAACDKRKNETALARAQAEQTARQGEARAAAIAAEFGRIDEDEQAERAVIDEAKMQAEEAAMQLDELGMALEEARINRLDAETGLELARHRSRELERAAQEARFALTTAESRVSELARRRLELEEREAMLAEKVETMALEREELADDDLDERLHEALYAREQCEEALAAARDASHAAQERLRELTLARQGAEGGLAPLRERYNEWLLKAQEAKIAFERYSEELAEARADEDALLALLPEAKKASALTAEIGRLAQAVNALGAVNLAALDELKAAQERHDYLQAQHEDLVAAMTTLEEAIGKIDAETREMFKATYDQVNASMAELFPLLFGGGRAELTLTGEDLLDAGIQILAQPPGKKNSTIHLLSGGEKALTAMSLVFSLFRLNPAPFCLLDEVDAPLDDANTGRFCQLVKQMSDRTQFLYISHNRLTMEIAEQLVGVTMQEQGVSRVVAVDIVEALRMREMA